MREFSVGELVYSVSSYGVELGRIESNTDPDSDYMLIACGHGYTRDGKFYKSNTYGQLVHATKENYEHLAALFGVDNVPNLDPVGSDLTRKLLKDGNKVLCFVSDSNDADAISSEYVRLISSYSSNSGFLTNGSVVTYAYAVPVWDLKFVTK